MRLVIAWKAFWKALKNPQKGSAFLEEKEKKIAEDHSHLRLLYLLQKSGRLIDFLKEDISTFSNDQIGAAVRPIHSECARCLEEFVTLRPLMSETEGSKVTVPIGYSAAEIKVVGRVKGQPPYQGILQHKGWKAQRYSLPKYAEEASGVICPAEVEVRG